ncbi:MAG TPA: amidohydrolase family protein [Hyphomicrobiaceae bacterium]|nr:amidohydrolase family protein [Hyphomicrobiaceae bacterium]
MSAVIENAQPAAAGAAALAGAIDCDVHPRAPYLRELMPYFDAHWADWARYRDILMRELTSFPPNAPLVRRHDWGVKGESGGTLETIQAQVLDRWQLKAAILTPVFAGSIMHDPHLGTALCRAHNDWIARDWLDKDARLRASIVINMGRPEAAAAEIDRVAADKRFVQAIVPVQTEFTLGRAFNKPVFDALTRHGLALGIHAGSMFRNPASQSGFYSTFSEDYANHISAFTAQVGSLIAEGVLAEYPDLKVVLIESGVTWMPAFMWRFSKDWRGVRNEVPWVDTSPAELMRRHVRLTTQPFDAPAAAAGRIVQQLGSADMLLFASDYPHWHFDGDAAIPDGMPEDQLQRMLVDNALATYPRLGGLE